MTAPVKRTYVRVGALPAPELVSLVDDPAGPYAGSSEGCLKAGGRSTAGRSTQSPESSVCLAPTSLPARPLAPGTRG